MAGIDRFIPTYERLMGPSSMAGLDGGWVGGADLRRLGLERFHYGVLSGTYEFLHYIQKSPQAGSVLDVKSSLNKE